MIESGELFGWIGGAFLLGIVGSGHCLGMCGGIASALGLASRSAAPEGGGTPPGLAPLLHGLGRVATYSLIGAVLGGLGHATHVLLGLGPWLRFAAGLLVVAFGLQLMGVRVGTEQIERAGLAVWRRIAPMSAKLGRGGSVWGAVLLGGFWGLLPCGLVYSAAAAATATGSAVSGAAFMLVFGLGTMPALLLSTGVVVGGFGAQLRRPPVRRLAGVVMVLLGAWSIWSGSLRGGHGDHAATDPTLLPASAPSASAHGMHGTGEAHPSPEPHVHPGRG